MKMQEKFQAAMQEIADERDLDLLVEHSQANAGWYSFQPREAFEPLLRFPFAFNAGSSSFHSGIRPEPLGPGPEGSPWSDWSYVRGGEHDLALIRVRALLDGEPDVVRIVVLPDGQTFGPLAGSRVCEVPAWFDADAIEEALAAGSLEGRELR